MGVSRLWAGVAAGLVLVSTGGALGQETKKTAADFTRAIQANPRDPGALCDYGDFLEYQQGDIDGAEKFYKMALEMDEKHAKSHYKYANLLHNRRKKLDEAEKHFKRAVEIDPKYLRALNNYGALLEDKKDYDGAEAMWERTIRTSNGGFPVSHVNLGRLHWRVRRNIDAAEDEFRKAVGVYPGYADAWRLLGDLLREERGRLEDAAEAYRTALREDEHQVYATYGLAIVTAQQGDVAKGEKLIAEAIAKRPKDRDLRATYGDFLIIQKKDYVAAEKAAQELIRLDSKDWRGHQLLGRALGESKKDLAASERAYRASLALDGENYDSLCGLGFALRHQKKFDAAVRAYLDAEKIDSKNPFAISRVGDTLLAKGDANAAAKAYDRALQANPKDRYTLMRYSVMLDERKDPKAGEMYKRAAALEPGAANELGNYARWLIGQGNLEEGRAALAKALALVDKASKDTAAEVWFYAYACGDEAGRSKALQSLKKLMKDGARSPGWDLSMIVAQAEKAKHPEAAWLGKLAAVINDTGKMETLEGWEGWGKVK